MEDVGENDGGLEVPCALTSGTITEDLSTSTDSYNEKSDSSSDETPCKIAVDNREEPISENIVSNSNTNEDNSSSKCVSNLECTDSNNEYNNNEPSTSDQLESFLSCENDGEELTFSSFKSKVVYKDIASENDMSGEGDEGTVEGEDEEEDEDNVSGVSSEDSSSGFYSGGTVGFENYLTNLDVNGSMLDQHHQMLFDDEDYDDTDESDAFLSPVDRLRRQAASLTVTTRENVCMQVEGTLEQARGSPVEVEALFEMVERLAEDPAAGVRVEMVASVPRLMAVCRAHSELGALVGATLLPLLLRHPTQPPNQSALLAVLEGGLLSEEELELLCEDITGPRHDSDAGPLVTLLGRVAPLLPRAALTRHVLPRYAALCRHAQWQARKSAALAFGGVATVAGLRLTEDVLVPLFVALVHDAVWEVRKACCEAFTEVSGACLASTRQASLSCLYLQLLADRSGWVRTCAYENLGMFLSSYAQSADEESSSEPQAALSPEPSSEPKEPPPQNFNSFNYWRLPLPDVVLPDLPGGESKEKPVNVKVVVSSGCEKAGPAVQFGEILAAENCENADLNTSSDSTDSEDTVIDLSSMQEGLLTLDEDMEHDVLPLELVRGTAIAPRSTWGVMTPADDGYTPPLVRFFKNVMIPSQAGLDPELVVEINNVVGTQSVVPRELLKQFLLMVDPQKAEPGGNDIAFQCAYAMPALALTLGRQNWRVLRGTYAHLAKNYQWRVRRTLAHSIAIIADIIGPENTARDLLPIYSKLLETESEFVKLGLLENMAGLVKALPARCRAEVLGMRHYFSLKDWKTREVIAGQLQDMIRYYSIHEVAKHLMDYCMELLCDTVIHNRTKTLKLMSLVIEHLLQDGTSEAVVALSARLCARFADATSWTHRQTFVLFCECLWIDNVLPPELFCELFLPSFLKLGRDLVPNVRLVLAEVLSRSFVSHTLFADDTCPLRSMYSLLQVDVDRDVRTLACSLVPEDSVCMDAFPPKEKQPFCRDVQTPNRTNEVYYRLENGTLVRDDKPALEQTFSTNSTFLANDSKSDNAASAEGTSMETSPDWW